MFLAVMLALSLAASMMGAMLVPTSAFPLLLVVWVGFGGVLMSLIGITVALWITTEPSAIQIQNQAPLWRLQHVASPSVLALWWLSLELGPSPVRYLISAACFVFLVVHLLRLLADRFRLASIIDSRARRPGWGRPQIWTLVTLVSVALVISIVMRVISRAYQTFDDGTSFLVAAMSIIWIVFLGVPRSLATRLASVCTAAQP